MKSRTIENADDRTKAMKAIMPVSALFHNLIGHRYNRLVVVGYAGKTSRKSLWECMCDCGNSHVVRSDSLKNGAIKSCGCLNKELCTIRNTKHGHSRAAEYVAWLGMKRRCADKNTIGYMNYGGRGITVCDRWLNSFESFLHDMGKRPTNLHSIDREDNDGNYEPNNCRWATATEQNRNQRLKCTNKSGVAGVGQQRDRVGWQVCISINGKTKHLGGYVDFFEAVCVRKSAENRYWHDN